MSVQGSRFFWRSKETIDVAFHHNSDEGLITISTRSLERAYNYPAIFVDAAKIPVPKSEAVSRRYLCCWWRCRHHVGGIRSMLSTLAPAAPPHPRFLVSSPIFPNICGFS